MASGNVSRRVEKVVGYPPLVEMDDKQRWEFHKALLDANTFEDLLTVRYLPRRCRLPVSALLADVADDSVNSSLRHSSPAVSLLPSMQTSGAH
jgi:hypothetical protein